MFFFVLNMAGESSRERDAQRCWCTYIDGGIFWGLYDLPCIYHRNNPGLSEVSGEPFHPRRPRRIGNLMWNNIFNIRFAWITPMRRSTRISGWNGGISEPVNGRCHGGNAIGDHGVITTVSWTPPSYNGLSAGEPRC